ncbi:MAG TPA: NAD(P)-dependent oxidoreductase [Rhizomicrobium sp.]|nr:NAD(P)-dependent oxidoreductase [Rhizomicrobium sp.]
MSALKIGFIGVGAFGSRAAMRLLWSGFHDLNIYDTHEQTPRIFTGTHGGLLLGSPAMVAQLSDIVITALPSAAEMREVFFGWEGLAIEPKKNGLVMDIGVTDPSETVAMARKLGECGIQFVDAPAFGTPDDAREGRLTMVVGGDDSAVERCRPILEKLSQCVIRAGGPGSAQAAAAIADYLRAARLLAASEAIRLGSHFGFEPANLLEVCDALGGAGVDKTLRNEVATRRFKTGHQLGLMRANVELADRLASTAGLPSPMLTAVKDALAGAEQLLGYSMDHTALIKWLETLTPPEPARPTTSETTAPA